MYEGLSPRGRGNPFPSNLPKTLVRSIPAWAGKPEGTNKTLLTCRVYPRVGGETWTGHELLSDEDGLSPRGRGNLSSIANRSPGWRSIPAWAGKPENDLAGIDAIGVYPRVGGETPKWKKKGQHDSGLSPRGRGNRR